MSERIAQAVQMFSQFKTLSDSLFAKFQQRVATLQSQVQTLETQLSTASTDEGQEQVLLDEIQKGLTELAAIAAVIDPPTPANPTPANPTPASTPTPTQPAQAAT